MGTVTIGSPGVTYTIYGEHLGAGSCDEYATGSLAYSATWAAASADSGKQQKQALIEATRILDRAPWNGTKTVAGQALAWPRTGVNRADGTAVDPNTIPIEIINACYELALAGLAKPALFTGVTTEDKIKRVEAKGVEVEWFGPRSGGRWPGRVGELVGQFLAGAGASTLGGSSAYGTSECSDFDDSDRFGVSGPG
jgi:hypothetical protein